jgi:nucleotide-binding universal stress UspA family protein
VLTHAFVSSTAAGLVAAENRRLRDLADAVAKKAHGEAAAAGVRAVVETRHLPRPQLVDAIAAQARLHDLSILDGELNPMDVDRTLIEAMLLTSGRPVIIVPSNWSSLSFETILIAWDGSAASTRAVNDALPLLKAASRIRIVSVTGEKDLSKAIPGAGIGQHLARHDIDAAIESISAVRGDAGEALRRHASEHKADLLIMGAFVHTRLRQWVLGGVTQSMLKMSNVPLFMAH